jgi:hypothetical protein
LKTENRNFFLSFQDGNNYPKFFLFIYLFFFESVQADRGGEGRGREGRGGVGRGGEGSGGEGRGREGRD